jgi:hypothetical protein
MELRNQWKTLVIAFVLPYLQLLGCSLIGLGIGAVNDSNKRDYGRASGGGIDSVETESMVTIIKRDGTNIRGEYIGVVERPGYSDSYDLSISKSGYDGYLPQLGEAVTILTSQGSQEGLFLGIDRNFVLMQLKYEQDTTRVSLDSVVAVDGPEGQQLQGAELRTLVYNATVLSKSYVLMLADQQSVTIPYEAVDSIAVDRSGAMKGFVAGAIVDVAVIACTVVSIKKNNSGCTISSPR